MQLPIQENYTRRRTQICEHAGVRTLCPTQVKGGARIAGLALMNRNGYGMQFPYVYAFAGDEHLMVVFQEVPHMKAPDGN